jgi:hypothetical protein
MAAMGVHMWGTAWVTRWQRGKRLESNCIQVGVCTLKRTAHLIVGVHHGVGSGRGRDAKWCAFSWWGRFKKCVWLWLWWLRCGVPFRCMQTGAVRTHVSRTSSPAASVPRMQLDGCDALAYDHVDSAVRASSQPLPPGRPVRPEGLKSQVNLWPGEGEQNQ